MKVIDFNNSDMIEFFNEIIESYFYPLDNSRVIILGIESGGIPLSRELYRLFAEHGCNNIVHEKISCRRPTTELKKKNLFRQKVLRILFKLIPKAGLNLLRNMEHNKLSRRKSSDMKRSLHMDFNTEVLWNSDIVLVVDDAVDSGASLKAVVDFISDSCAKKEGVQPRIKTIVIAVTQKAPLIEPDFVWKRNVLVRFPWSLDG